MTFFKNQHYGYIFIKPKKYTLDVYKGLVCTLEPKERAPYIDLNEDE